MTLVRAIRMALSGRPDGLLVDATCDTESEAIWEMARLELEAQAAEVRRDIGRGGMGVR